MRVDPQEAFAEDDEASDVLNSIGRKIMNLDAVHIEECTEKGMKRK